MLPLSNIKNWQKLENAYGNSEEIPALIQSLYHQYDQKILDEICWEYIFHQNSLYQATFATIPYLIDFAEKSEDSNIKWDIFTNVGLIVVDIDIKSPDFLADMYVDCNLEKSIIEDIISSYKNAFQVFKNMGLPLLNYAKTQDEAEKRYFLACLAVTNEFHSIAKVFATFNNNDEYMCVCGACESEFHLWSENDQLVMYQEDPVFNKNQHPLLINKNNLASEITDLKLKNDKYAWMKYHIDLIEIRSLQNLLDYFFAEINCPNCGTKFIIFEQIENSVM